MEQGSAFGPQGIPGPVGPGGLNVPAVPGAMAPGPLTPGAMGLPLTPPGMQLIPRPVVGVPGMAMMPPGGQAGMHQGIHPSMYPSMHPGMYPSMYPSMLPSMHPGVQPGMQVSPTPPGVHAPGHGPEEALPGVAAPGVSHPILPLEESYIENILRMNLGKIATVYMTYESNARWNAMVFKGRVEAAGRDHIIISDPRTGKRFLLLMVNLDYVEFDEPLRYVPPPLPGLVAPRDLTGTAPPVE